MCHSLKSEKINDLYDSFQYYSRIMLVNEKVNEGLVSLLYYVVKIMFNEKDRDYSKTLYHNKYLLGGKEKKKNP